MFNKQYWIALLLLPAFGVGLLCAAEMTEKTLAVQLLESYSAVESVSCDIRRSWLGPDGPVRMNSTVHWQRPERLHVENHSPLQRRYVCDGTNFFYFVTGDPRGFSRTVDALDEEWRMRLNVVPGTAMDRLLLLAELTEIVLEPDAEGHVRRGYETKNGFAVLTVDRQSRLIRFELFAAAGDASPVIKIEYAGFEEVLPGVWIPMRHAVTVADNGRLRTEALRVSMFEINKPQKPELFVPERYFKGVQFVDSFEKIYGR